MDAELQRARLKALQMIYELAVIEEDAETLQEMVRIANKIQHTQLKESSNDSSG